MALNFCFLLFMKYYNCLITLIIYVINNRRLIGGTVTLYGELKDVRLFTKAVEHTCIRSTDRIVLVFLLAFYL